MVCGVSSLLLRGKSGALWSAPLVYPLPKWLGAAAGAGCARVLRSVNLQKLLEDFLIRVVSLLALFALGTRALLGSTVDTCSTGGFGRISLIFYVAVNSNPEASALHSC